LTSDPLVPASFKEEGVEAVRLSDPGESAMGLPWLSPGAESLVALARSSSPSVWLQIRHDPGAVLLIARHLTAQSTLTFPEQLFQSAAPLEHALYRLQDSPHSLVDWSRPEIEPVYRAAIAYAEVAERIAKRIGSVEPACAWIGGLLAPLGWLAMCAVDPDAVSVCLRQPVFAENVFDIQQDAWSIDAAALARRLARRWDLPTWLCAVVGCLNHQPSDFDLNENDSCVFEIIQLAVLWGQSNGHELGLHRGLDCSALLQRLGLTEEDLNNIGAEWCVEESLQSTRKTHFEHEPSTLLPKLLAVAIENRRLNSGPLGNRLEREIDLLHQSLLEQRKTESERLHKQKLRALVELAAGAGHEINNPLAVISGQCQYLLRREDDPDRRESLRIVIRQTERVHQILMDLMQFARPAAPQRKSIDLNSLVAEVVARQHPFAQAQGVRVEWRPRQSAPMALIDEDMCRTAFAAVLRNACDAAGRNGWVRLELTATNRKWLLSIEDSGPGPSPHQVEHLFDPFYSGRTAGRGRGLGLSTAWRLLNENGGDVRFEPSAESPSRFVLILPQAELADNSAPAETAIYPARKIA
jgi:signal transduction histidine kinase